MLTWVRALGMYAACTLLSVSAHANDTPAPKASPETSVFRVEAVHSDGRIISGSGVLVAPHVLVTNCHVVLQAQDIGVSTTHGRLPVRLSRAHTARDLCLLDAPGLTGTAAVLGATTDKHIGEMITAIGYPLHNPLTRSRGHIEGLYTYRGPGRVVQGSAVFNAGKSGGGLFDNDGRLIGILTFKCRAGGPYHFAVPVEWVESLLHDDSPVAKVQAYVEAPFWQNTGEQLPLFIRAASLSAEGNCAVLYELAAQWLAREPGNLEAMLTLTQARRCKTRDPTTARVPLLQWLSTLGM